MIERSGRVALSNGEKTIWVNPDEAQSWAIHGYVAQGETSVVMKAPVQKPLKQDQSEDKENQ